MLGVFTYMATDDQLRSLTFWNLGSLVDPVPVDLVADVPGQTLVLTTRTYNRKTPVYALEGRLYVQPSVLTNGRAPAPEQGGNPWKREPFHCLAAPWKGTARPAGSGSSANDCATPIQAPADRPQENAPASNGMVATH